MQIINFMQVAHTFPLNIDVFVLVGCDSILQQ